MTIQTFTVALDTSSRTAALAVSRGRELLMETAMPVTGKASSQLLPAIIDALADVGLGLDDVATWLVGMGPGSFSGIRSGAALVKGIARGTGATCGGVPSSLAMAAAINDAPPSLTVLHNGRRGEVICSPYVRAADGALEPSSPFACPIANLGAALDTTCVMLADDPAHEQVAAIVTNLATLPAVPAATMTSLAPGPLEPIYVRPAVFVAPKPVAPIA